jgi:hypothetical protein
MFGRDGRELCEVYIGDKMIWWRGADRDVALC